MGQMKVIEGAAFGGAEVLELKEVESPLPSQGSLLIDVAAAGVNYLDVVARAGFMPAYFSAPPFRLGFEIAGTVREVGAGVTNWKRGDAVAAVTLGGGGYASQIVVPANAAIPVPKGLDLNVVAALLVQGLTAFLTLEVGNVRPGANVLVSAAAGGVGALAVQTAKLRGANVIGLASSGKHEFVRKNGAEHVFDYRRPGWSASAREAMGDRGVDFFLDSVGDLQAAASLAHRQFEGRETVGKILLIP